MNGNSGMQIEPCWVESVSCAAVGCVSMVTHGKAQGPTRQHPVKVQRVPFQAYNSKQIHALFSTHSLSYINKFYYSTIKQQRNFGKELEQKGVFEMILSGPPFYLFSFKHQSPFLILVLWDVTNRQVSLQLSLS